MLVVVVVIALAATAVVVAVAIVVVAVAVVVVVHFTSLHSLRAMRMCCPTDIMPKRTCNFVAVAVAWLLPLLWVVIGCQCHNRCWCWWR